MAELVLGGVGAAAGSLIPGVGWMVGFQIGVTLGSLLFPPSGPKLERGRVDEIRIQGAQQGSPIPIIYGRNRTAGTIIWATGLIESSATVSAGGKGGGGPTSTEYSYSSSLAVLVCEGPLTKIRRIWANETVIYDWRVGVSPDYANYIDPAKLRIYLGTQTLPDAAIEADKGVGNVPAFKGMAYVVFDEFPLGEFGNSVPNFTFEVESDHANLQVAFEDIASKIGLDPTDYDFSTLSSYPTRGMIIGARTEAGRVMEAFAKANLFEIVESQGKIKSIIRNGNSVLTIPADDIGAAEYGDTDTPRFVTTKRSEETELPRELVVAYQAEALDFLQWTQVARRTVRWSENQDQVSFPMGLADAYARYLADAFLMEAWVSRSSHSFSLPYKYLRLDPGDVVTVTDEGGSNRSVRILEMSSGLLAQIQVTAVDDDPITYVNPGLPASIPTGGGAGVGSPNDAELVVFETNAVYDDLADSPQLGIAAGRTAAGWKGGDAESDPKMSEDGYGPRLKIANFRSGSTFGQTDAGGAGALGHAGGPGILTGLDTTNTVRVTLVSGTLSSCTYEELVTEGANLCIIDKEILQFQTATLVAGTTYDLSNFLRFRRGTDYLYAQLDFAEWVGHATSENFALVNSKMKNFAYDEICLGETYSHRLIESGKSYSGGLPPFQNPIVASGDARRPYPPCRLYYSGGRDPSPADVSLYWTRRVRKRGDLTNYQDALLDELIESYTVEIWSDTLGTLYASYTHTGPPPFVFTVAEQTLYSIESDNFQFAVRQTSFYPGIGDGYRSSPKYVSLADDVIY